MQFLRRYKMSVSINTFLPHEWQRYRDLRLRALADSPDAFGSTLAHEQRRTDDEWAARLINASTSRADLPLVARVRGQAAGLAWAKINPLDHKVVNLYQMWVAPEFRQLGVGQLLLNRAIDWAREVNAQSMMLGVTCSNSAALRLYTRTGFVAVGDPELLRAGATLSSQTMQLFL
ncbi:MAG: GNAT family N-acetyltransferase [Chloroflexi bacterium]|nr:GNAT family N-acetyltransferase [Chloroflexota bacterium]